MGKLRALGALQANPFHGQRKRLVRAAVDARSRDGKVPLQEMNLLWSCVMARVPKPCSKLSCDRVGEGKEAVGRGEEVKLGASFSGVVQVKQVNI